MKTIQLLFFAMLAAWLYFMLMTADQGLLAFSIAFISTLPLVVYCAVKASLTIEG